MPRPVIAATMTGLSSLLIMKPSSKSLLVLFFLSGATSLAYETVFVKLLGYVFGNTTYAVSTILAAFMGGLAVGSYVFGKYVERGRNGLKLYAYLELGVGLYCAFVPLIFRGLEPIYVRLYQNYHFSFGQLTAVRFLLSLVLVLPPTILMGGTLPAMTKYLVQHAGHIGRRVSLLYAVNTFGAAFGVFSVTFFILGALGIYGTLGLAVVGNLIIFGIALWLLRGTSQVEPVTGAIPVPVSEDLPSWPVRKLEHGFDVLASGLGFRPTESETLPASASSALHRWLYCVAFLSGVISFAYEVAWTHVLAQTVGTSAYAFGTMLTTMLLGIALGSHFVKQVIDEHKSAECRLVLSQFALGVAVFALLPLWDDIPRLFQLTEFFRPSFTLTESIRFIGCFTVMFLPALLIGMSFPLVMKVQARKLPGLAEQIGIVYFFNTIGCIFGSTVTGFLLLPYLGAERLMRVSAAANLGLAVLIAVVFLSQHKQFLRRFVALTVAVCVLGFTIIPKWDLNHLNVGAHVLSSYTYANPLNQKILFYHEDVLGGVTSVVQSDTTRTLLANAKFQGNDTHEVPAQKQFAIVPLLFTRNYNQSLVIGLGTGTTASVIGAFPFSEIDIAEISPGIVTAAHDYFGHLNRNILDDPRVKLHVTDGRNYVLLTPKQYDLISIELTNIWFAGAANLYSQNFYELCRKRLRSGGVFQQWVQIHHMDPVDLISIVKTMHSVFPHMAFFVGGGQGILLGSDQPLEVNFKTLESLNERPQIHQCLDNASIVGNDMLSVLSGLYLYDQSVVEFINSEPMAEISTDWYPFLEYTTPRGNQLPYSRLANLKLLESYWYRKLPRLTDATEADMLYLQGLVETGRGNHAQAVRWLEQALAKGNQNPRCSELLRKEREALAK